MRGEGEGEDGDLRGDRARRPPGGARRSDCAPSSSIEMGAASGKGAAPAATRATSGGEDATSASAGEGAVRTRASRATSVLAAREAPRDARE